MFKNNGNGTYLKVGTDEIHNPVSQEFLNFISAGNTPLPADPTPNPAIAKIDAQLAEIDNLSQRPARDCALGSGSIPDATGTTPLQRLQALEAEAVALRAKRKLLPALI